jgi:hypothetical protein
MHRAAIEMSLSTSLNGVIESCGINTQTRPLSPVKVISGRRMMNKFVASKHVRFKSITLALVAIVLVVTGSSASAKTRKPKKSGKESLVVAHIPFGELSVVDMVMHGQGDAKRYLYVQHEGEEGVTVIDISDPGKTKVVRTIPWPNPQVSNRMNVAGDLAIITETEVRPRPSASTQDVVLWDLSDPATPRELQRFAGVVKVLEDDRNFLYVLNTEGLWVISKPDQAPQQDSSSSYGG